MGCCPRGLQDTGRLLLAGYRIAKASGELVPVLALGLGEHSRAGSKTPQRSKRLNDLVAIGKGVRGKPAAPGAPALTVKGGSGGGRHDKGTIVKVTADEPPPGKKFAGWSGDTQILANPSEETTTATIPSIDVTIPQPTQTRFHQASSRNRAPAP